MLRLGGLFILITYGGPDYRLPYLEDPAYGWDVLVYALGRDGGHDEQGPSSQDEPPPPPTPAPVVTPQMSPHPPRLSGRSDEAAATGDVTNTAVQAIGNDRPSLGPGKGGWTRPTSLEWAHGPRLRGPWAAFNPAHRQVYVSPSPKLI